jgi:hypothetical protein
VVAQVLEERERERERGGGGGEEIRWWRLTIQRRQLGIRRWQLDIRWQLVSEDDSGLREDESGDGGDFARRRSGGADGGRMGKYEVGGDLAGEEEVRGWGAHGEG